MRVPSCESPSKDEGPTFAASVLPAPQFVDDLHRSVDRGEMDVYYQPIWDLATGELDAFEALLRWRHPTWGVIAPDFFVPLAEESGFIAELGSWVLLRACADANEWVASGRRVSIAVNISPRQFELQSVERIVGEALALTGLDPRCLDLEITENVAVADVDAVAGALRRLRELGVGCALDDFGSGFNGMATLGRLPVDGLKIDKSLISRIHVSETARAIYRAVADLGHELGARTVAEGVEHPHQIGLLRAMGVDRIQGFLVARPLPAAQARSLVGSRPPEGRVPTPA